jgi:hypothetical protein
VKTKTRVALVRFACLGLSCYLAWPLLDISPPRKLPDLRMPVAQSVRLHAPVRKVAEVKREQVIIRSKTAPEKKLAATKIAKVEAALPVAAVPQVPPAVTPPPVEIPQLVLSEPPTPNDLPPAPPDDDRPALAHFADKPGGTVVVLAVQLNSDNEVVMTDILVASSTPFNDLTFAMTTKGSKWKDVKPPIPPGEYRWVEVRFDYASPATNTNVLP